MMIFNFVGFCFFFTVKYTVLCTVTEELASCVYKEVGLPAMAIVKGRFK